MKLSLILVCHHSGDVLPACVASFRRQAEGLGVELEAIAVEQSEDRQALAAVCDLGLDLVVERTNRGYAAGLNAGVAEATGDVLLLANPDIELLDGSLEALLGALGPGTAVAGPQLVWDREGSLLLPAPDDPAPSAELRRAWRRRSQRAWQADLHHEIERSWRLWNSSGPEPVRCLRGPLLVLRHRDWERLGPLDEGYFLYFEETEWLWRAVHRGLRLVLVGDAPVAHRWGHATSLRSDLDAIEQSSRRRFHERNYPPVKRLAIRWLDGWRREAGVAATAVAGPAAVPAVPAVQAELWLLSPFRHLMPAAGCLDALSPAVTELASRGRWFLAAAARHKGRWQITDSWVWGRA